jgi:metal-responsive CopG/Arc/MetJ family transcriptional regulator
MKTKTSVTLSSDILSEVDRRAGSKASRSAFIENVLRDHFKAKMREAINARDLELINAHSDYFARESRELDEYQTPINWDDDTR